MSEIKNLKVYINVLRQCAKEHENDRIPFAHIRTTDLCNDTADLLEKIDSEDLMSKEEVKKNIRSYISYLNKDQANNICFEIDNNVPTVDAVEIPKGATNGDMIKAAFPNIQFDENKYYDLELMPGYYNDCLLILVDKNLWNASYKIKSEKGR